MAVVGGGIVGLAVARELTRRRPGAKVLVLEKEDRLAAHQTGHNSGVVHAGIYYRPGSLKAELCARGRVLLRDYCLEHSLPYVECGKLVVAVDPGEMGRFDALERTATRTASPACAGSVPRDRRDRAARDRSGRAALALHRHHRLFAIARAPRRGGRGRGRRRTASRPTVTGLRSGTAAGSRSPPARGMHSSTTWCSVRGLQADRLGRRLDGNVEPRIVPFRGEYLSVVGAKRDFVRGMVYPVPDPRYPFLGVHFTRRVDGGLEIGPNAVLALDREGYGVRPGVRLADAAATLAHPGFWRMARTHWRTGARESAARSRSAPISVRPSATCAPSDPAT